MKENKLCLTQYILMSEPVVKLFLVSSRPYGDLHAYQWSKPIKGGR